MLEIPESRVVSEQLNRMAAGKTIRNVYPNHSPHKFAFFFDDPANYHSLLSGKTLSKAVPIGGQIELYADNARIVFGDGVNIRFFSEEDTLPEKHQLRIEFDDFSSIVCSVQMYGGLSAFLDGQNDNFYYHVAKEKPSPLSADFNESYFDTLFSSAKATLSAKAFLATEQRIPGLGNGVLQDILFLAQIHPKSKISTLNDAKKEKLFESVKHTLFEMTSKGGRDTEKDLFGSSGGYKTHLSSKTLKEPCPVCGDSIVRQAFLGGNIYFCPSCQPLTA